MFAIIDTSMTFVLRVRLLSALNRMVICDRYVDDAIVDLKLRFPLAAVDQRVSIRMLRRLAPRPALAVLFVLDWDEMLRRVEEKSEPFPDSPQIRRKRFDAYDALAGTDGYLTIDAARPIEEIHTEILETLAR